MEWTRLLHVGLRPALLTLHCVISAVPWIQVETETPRFWFALLQANEGGWKNPTTWTNDFGHRYRRRLARPCLCHARCHAPSLRFQLRQRLRSVQQ